MKKQYSLSVKQPKSLKDNPFIINGLKLLRCTALAEIKNIQGTTIQMEYVRVKYINILLQILYHLHLYCEHKEIIYWNPNKSTISGSNKYSEVGPKSRGTHAKVWFEVNPANKIYRVGMDKYVYSKELPIPFPGTHLDKVTSKRLKSLLDEVMYQNK